MIIGRASSRISYYSRAKVTTRHLPSQRTYRPILNFIPLDHSTDNMDVREKLRQHFMDQPADAQTGRWDAMWQQQVTPWDRWAPNPALVDVLNEKSNLIGGPANSDKRPKALVPGCGRGYDVLLFASHGYNAYGLDASQTAIAACNALEKDQGDDPSKYPAQTSRGERKFLYADFFKDDFLAQTNGGNFDVIYDYTFLCALPPELRPKWASRMSELLAPDGRLVCLEFPLAKPPASGGPPHGLSSELYVQLFKRPGEEVRYGEDGYVLPEAGEADAKTGFVRVEHWQPERTHEVGKGTDWVSVWKHV